MKKYIVENRIGYNILFAVLILMLLISLFFANSFDYVLKLKPKIDSSSHTQIHFIDVGQGDAIAIKFSNEKVMLIDSGTKEYNKKLDNYLKNILLKNNKTIDYLVLTHPDIDHSGNMQYIMNNYKIGTFFRPKIFESFEGERPSCDNETYKNLLINAIRLGINTQFVEDKVFYEDTTKISFLTVIDRVSDKNSLSTNDFSPIIMIEDCGKKAMLTGDISSEMEELFIEKYSNSLDIDVLKLSHHGSKNSNCKEFLDITSPNFVVATCGENTYGHPANATLQRILDYDKNNNVKSFSNFFTTKDDGNIVCSLYGQIKIETIKNIDDYNFVGYYIYCIGAIIYILCIALRPYYDVWKKNNRFQTRNISYSLESKKHNK